MAKSKEYQSAYSEKKSIKETIEYSDRLGGGRSSVSIQVEFRGTPEEKDRAMEISGYIVGKIMGKAKTTGFALENPYIASENEKQFAEKIKEKLGKNATMQDYMEYAVSVSPDIKYLKSEKSASAVIRKYGDKVPTDAIGKISNFISSKKINQLKNAHRQKTEETKRKTQEFVKKNGYLKQGNTIDVKSKLPSDLSGITKVTGKTYDHRGTLKKLGFKWNGEAWVK